MLRLTSLLLLLPLLAGAEVTYVPPAGGAQSVTLPYDWADPSAETGSDELSAINQSNWTDASAHGGTTSACITTVDSRLLRLDSRTATNCSTPTTGNRAQGLLHTIGSGNFTAILRVSFARDVTLATVSYVVTESVVFVDGADVSTASWYGLGAYLGTEQVSNLYAFWNDATETPRFDTYDIGNSSYTLLGTNVDWSDGADVALVRSGTTLTAYIARPGGGFLLAKTWTVTTGAGYVGIRTQNLLNESDNAIMTLKAFRTSLTTLP